MKIDFTKAIELLNKSKKIGLITHIKSDGDAMGSILAMRDALELLNKEVIIFSNEEIRQEIEFLNEFADYKYQEEYEETDLVIILDASFAERCTCSGVIKESIKNKVPTMVIDHHEPGDRDIGADVFLRTTEISSTAEIVFWLFKKMDLKITKNIAEYLLLGIETDTSFLRNPNTFESTKRAKEEMINLGARDSFIINKIKESSVIFSNEEFRKVIDSRIVKNDNGVVTTYITQGDHERFGIDPGISSITSNYVDASFGGKITMVLEERPQGMIKVSLRSNNSGINVARLCEFFGGGGHKQAAGFEYQGKLSDLLAK